MNESPVLALAGLMAVGLLATRLPRPHWLPAQRLDRVVGIGPPVLLGIVLGPGIDLLSPPVLRALAPVTALAIGWIGAVLGARFEWRHVRRVPRGTWLVAVLAAAAAFGAVAVAAWLAGRRIPALGTAWAPRLPAILTLGAVAATSWPGAVARVAGALGIGGRAARAFGRTAALQAACGALAMTIPLALHRPHQPAGSAALGWLVSIAATVCCGALVTLAFLALRRLRPARAELPVALFTALLFGVGIGYAADLSPFVVCALAAALIVHLAPERLLVSRVLVDWEPPLYAVGLVLAGALFRVPSVWLLAAAPGLAALRIAAQWASVRFGREPLKLGPWPPEAGLATVAQGGAAIALALNFLLIYGGPGDGSAGAVLTTVVVGVAVADLVAPPLMRRVQGVAFAPLTRPSALPELSPNAPAD